MAWKVYGFMEGRDADGKRFPAIYGPLPCKRWVSVPGEKYKVRKQPAPRGSGLDPVKTDERRAVAYARWLAARDGIELPEGSAAVQWDGVRTLAGKWSRRIRAVSFHGKGKGQIINLPNWDFDPAPPVESVVDAETAFADLLPLAYIILAGIDTSESVREMEAA